MEENKEIPLPTIKDMTVQELNNITKGIRMTVEIEDRYGHIAYHGKLIHNGLNLVGIGLILIAISNIAVAIIKKKLK